MENQYDLSRFTEAQKGIYESALQEIKKGKKTSHWMWFIFPQIAGLGISSTAKFYAIKNETEAMQYLNHPVLGQRLIEISHELLKLHTNDPVEVFGETDSVKLKSSMTLFSLQEKSDPVFRHVLDKYFHGKNDEKTIYLLN